MQYISDDELETLTASADRAQRMIDATLDDIEAMPTSSIEFRLSSLKQVIDAIYRLTAIRKTLAALRASFERNTDGLRELTQMMRSLHEHLQTLQGTTSTPRPPAAAFEANPNDNPANDEDEDKYDDEEERDEDLNFAFKLPADWNLAPKRYASDWPPFDDEIIPEPRLPHSLVTPDPSAPGFPNAPKAAVGDVGVLPNDQATHESMGSIQSTQSISPAQSNSTSDPQPSTLLSSLMSRIPASISDPNFKLPEESNNASDYASLIQLDLVPRTRSIATLPLSSSDLTERVYDEFGHIINTTVNLRADIMKLNPEPETPSIPFDPSNPSDTLDPMAPSAPSPDPPQPSSLSP